MPSSSIAKSKKRPHTQPAIEDHDDYAGATSYTTHSGQLMNTRRPGGYGGSGAAAFGRDPHGRAAAGGPGYEMQRPRTGTGAGLGIVGFTTDDVFARNAASNHRDTSRPTDETTLRTCTTPDTAKATTETSNTTTKHTTPLLHRPTRSPNQAGHAPVQAQAQMMMPEAQRHIYNNAGAFRQSPSYGEAHPGERVEYGHAAQQDDDPYRGYEPYEAGPSQSQGHASNPPAYVVGASGTAGATGHRKGGHVARQPSASGRSGATRYSDDEDDVEPPRRVLKVANE